MTKKKISIFFIYIFVITLISLFAMSIFYPLKFNILLDDSLIYIKTDFVLNSLEFLILSLFVFLGLIKSLEILLSFIKPKYEFHSYTSDNFKDIPWKWSWDGKEVVDLWCYCPKCDTELIHENDYLLYKTSFSCVQCEKELLSLKSDNINYILAGIKKEIKRISIKKFL